MSRILLSEFVGGYIDCENMHGMSNIQKYTLFYFHINYDLPYNTTHINFFLSLPCDFSIIIYCCYISTNFHIFGSLVTCSAIFTLPCMTVTVLPTEKGEQKCITFVFDPMFWVIINHKSCRI